MGETCIGIETLTGRVLQDKQTHRQTGRRINSQSVDRKRERERERERDRERERERGRVGESGRERFVQDASQKMAHRWDKSSFGFSNIGKPRDAIDGLTSNGVGAPLSPLESYRGSLSCAPSVGAGAGYFFFDPVVAYNNISLVRAR